MLGQDCDPAGEGVYGSEDPGSDGEGDVQEAKSGEDRVGAQLCDSSLPDGSLLRHRSVSWRHCYRNNARLLRISDLP